MYLPTPNSHQSSSAKISSQQHACLQTLKCGQSHLVLTHGSYAVFTAERSSSFAICELFWIQLVTSWASNNGQAIESITRGIPSNG
jgi:hypothetical protein